MAATGLTHHSNLEHMKAVEGFAELREVARRYDDDRGRRYCDVFGVVTGDINITHAYPGAVTAWHAHRRQYDEWFVIKGAFKVGLGHSERRRHIPLAVHQSFSVRWEDFAYTAGSAARLAEPHQGGSHPDVPHIGEVQSRRPG